MYNAEAHICCSAQPSVFYHIVLNAEVNTFPSFNSSIKRLLCAVVVEAFCLLSSDKNNETLHEVDNILWISLFLSVLVH